MPPFLPASPEIQAAIDEAVQTALLREQTNRQGEAIDSLTEAQNQLNGTLQDVNQTLQQIKTSVDGFKDTATEVAALKVKVGEHEALVAKLRRVQVLFYGGMGVAGLINPEVREFAAKFLSIILGAPAGG